MRFFNFDDKEALITPETNLNSDEEAPTNPEISSSGEASTNSASLACSVLRLSASLTFIMVLSYRFFLLLEPNSSDTETAQMPPSPGFKF